MNISKSKIVAIITGFISIAICILYLLLVTVFDFRSFLNEQITSLAENMAEVFYEIDYFDSYGDKPTWLIQKFMEKMGKKFLKHNREPHLIYNDKRKQYGNSECGMYSMYFLIANSSKKPIFLFLKILIVAF